MFWRPEVAADVVSFMSSPASLGPTITIADLRQFATVERRGVDGTHLLWNDFTQLWLAGSFELAQPLVAVLPFEAAGSRRAIAATNVLHRLAQRRQLSKTGLTRQAVDRFAFRLRALDGRRAGASHREIAAGLFGHDRIPAGTAWKSSERRSQIFRLVADGLELSKGGHIGLLR